MVVDVGDAVTDAPVVLLSPVAGLHVYELAPVAVRVADCPTQIAGGDNTAITGGGFMVTVTCAVAVHPFDVPVTVYVMVEVGDAVTDEPVVLLSPVAGLQVYELAPEAVRVVDCPAQIAEGVGTVTTGTGLTVTVTCAVAVQPFNVPVTV